jgi:regulator of protease activity HflC (stomatin/prohibitin superfamily)
MEKQMRAERDRRAIILEAEGRKQAQILHAEGDRDARVAEAEGRAKAQVVEATAQAEARLKLAEAEALSIDRIQESMGAGGLPSQYLVTMRYLESLKEIAAGNENRLVFMPYEATGVLSSLGGIKELLASSAAPARS